MRSGVILGRDEDEEDTKRKAKLFSLKKDEIMKYHHHLVMCRYGYGYGYGYGFKMSIGAG